MSNNLDYLIHPDKKNIINNFFNERQITEPFFEGPQGDQGESGMRGLRGDRGIRGSEGPAGPEGPAGDGLTEGDMISKTLWCVTDNQCATPKNIVARFRDDTLIKLGPNTAGNKSLILGGRSNETGEAGLYTTYGNLYVDAANADENDIEPGDIYFGKNSRGKTYINEDGNQTLLNDKSGYVGINMQGTMPDNNLHIKGDRPITVENTNPSSGTAGIKFNDNRSNQKFTIGSTNLGFFIKDDNNEKYSMVTKNGSTGIGTDNPDSNFSLHVGDHAKFTKDIRLTGGSDASLQVNFNQNIGDRKDFKSLNQGVEVMGGDVQRGKIRFFGNNMDIDYGPANDYRGKTLITFTREGVEFTGPVNFTDLATFSGPNPDGEYNDDDKVGLLVKNNAKFEGKTFHSPLGSMWGVKGEDDQWTMVQNNRLQTNMGLELYADNNDDKFGVISYTDQVSINDGLAINGEQVTKGGIVVEDNLIVKGSGSGNYYGIDTNLIKAQKAQIDSIKTVSSINYSDVRLKENIKLINQQENINKLMKMKGYEYRNKVTNENDKGVIAQQLESIVPEIVDSKDKYKGVKYNNIIPMLIEGIKYQQKEIEDLKKQIKK